jgi:hypothetical protein
MRGDGWEYAGGFVEGDKMDGFVLVAPTPSYLPHDGGGFSPLVGHDLAMTTERHLPL